jgi:hypothetical protein
LRGAALQDRHLLHEAGDFQIDLWLEAETDDRMWLAGQVLHRGGETAVTSGTPVIFVADDENIVGQSFADANGEFQQELQTNSTLKILFRIPDRGLIGVAVPDVTDSSAT